MQRFGRDNFREVVRSRNDSPAPRLSRDANVGKESWSADQNDVGIRCEVDGSFRTTLMSARGRVREFDAASS